MWKAELDGACVHCRPFVQSWLHQHFPSAGDESSRSYLQALFQEHVDPGLAWLRSLGSEYIPSVDNALVTSLCTLLQVDFLFSPVGSAFSVQWLLLSLCGTALLHEIVAFHISGRQFETEQVGSHESLLPSQQTFAAVATCDSLLQCSSRESAPRQSKPLYMF